MSNSWKPVITRKAPNRLPDEILRFFHEILTLVENDGNRTKGMDWRNLKSLEDRILIESDTRNKKIQIPSRISSGSIYFKGSEYKAFGFLKNLRHAFAHNYIEVTQDNAIRVALPNKNGKGLKLACNVSFQELKTVVATLKNKPQNRKTKTRRK